MLKDGSKKNKNETIDSKFISWLFKKETQIEKDDFIINSNWTQSKLVLHSTFSVCDVCAIVHAHI
eukprot:m.278006 g.278006  ORF g.278006 m.278006 type:complete len:65 (-) comp133312_c0_seq1:66-260(-)